MNLSREPSPAPIGILYVHSSASYYGSDNALYNMIKGLDPTCFRAVVVVPEEGPLIGRLEAIGVRVVRMPLAVLHRSLSPIFWLRFFGNLLVSTRTLAKLIREENIALIHSNTSHVFDGAVAATATGTPHLWQVREINTWRSALAPFLRIVVARLANRVVCVSEATRTALDLPAKFEDKASVIVDGIDLADFDSQRRHGVFRESVGVAPSQPLIGLVGRIVHWKGHEVFLAAADKLHAQFPDARFTIVGEAMTEKDLRFLETLKRWIAERGLTDIVRFAGARRDIATVMGDLDILVVPTLRGEAWGLVALEGMGAATPVIACDHDGPAEIIRDGEDGFLFDPDTVESLETLLQRLLASPELRRSIGAAARRSVQERFTLAKTVEAFCALYREMTGKR